MATETMDAAGPGRGGRMSRQRKRDAVLRLLRGEELELVSRSLGVTAATLSGWREAFLAAGEASRAVLSGSPFHGEGHRKVWARLRIAGVRTSKRRVLRLMREHGLLAPSRVGAPRGPRSHDGTIIPDRVDEMWGTDLTATWTG